MPSDRHPNRPTASQPAHSVLPCWCCCSARPHGAGRPTRTAPAANQTARLTRSGTCRASDLCSVELGPQAASGVFEQLGMLWPLGNLRFQEFGTVEVLTQPAKRVPQLDELFSSHSG